MIIHAGGVLHAVCCKALMAYLCALILLLLLSLIPIVPTAHWYQENVKGYSVLNSMNQTVVAPLEQHLYSISLQHNFTLTPCTLQTVAVPCNELKPNHTANVSDPNFFSGKKNEFLYLLNTSVINLHYDISTDSDVTSVAFWVFNNLTDYRSADAKVRSINCTSNHPRDGWPKCQNFTTKALNKSYYMLNYTVLAEHDSFYYLLCQQTTVTYGKQSCNSQYFLPSIDVYWYNFSIYNRGSNGNTGSITTEKSPLFLRKSFDPSLYISGPKKCLLMHTPDWGSCESQTNGIVVTVSDIVKVNDVGFFAGIALVFLLMVYIVVTLSIHVCLYRRERRQLRRPHHMYNQVRPGQPAANSTGVPG